MDENYDEFSDATTATAAQERKDEPDTATATATVAPPKAMTEVERALPEKSGSKRKIAFLFSDRGRYFFRVNFLPYEGTRIESHWVEATADGVLKVTPEENRPFKAEA